MTRLSIVGYFNPRTTQKIKRLRQALVREGGAAVGIPRWEPHLTLGDGIELNQSQLPAFKRLFRSFAAAQAAPRLRFSAIRHMPRKKGKKTVRAIYLAVEPARWIRGMMKKTDHLTGGYRRWYRQPRPYNPRVTLAYWSDRKKMPGLERLTQGFAPFETPFTHISLARQNTRKQGKKYFEVALKKAD